LEHHDPRQARPIEFEAFFSFMCSSNGVEHVAVEVGARSGVLYELRPINPCVSITPSSSVHYGAYSLTNKKTQHR
jgi:hypothetical protein